MFKILGWNARTTFSKHQIYSVKTILNVSKPDFFLIVDSGKYRSNMAPDIPLYSVIHHLDTLVIFYKKEISVSGLMPKEWSKHAMAVTVTLNNKSMILVNSYRRPNDQEAIHKIEAFINFLDRKYESTPIILFGDLNFPRNKVEKKFINL